MRHVDTAPLPWVSTGKEQPCYVLPGSWGWLGKWRDADGSYRTESWSPEGAEMVTAGPWAEWGSGARPTARTAWRASGEA